MRAAAEEALQRFRALGERWGLSSTLRVIGDVRVLDGDLDGRPRRLPRRWPR